MTREETTTAKVQTDFAPLYCHISHVAGAVTEIRFSSPGKFSDTAIEKLLAQLGDAATQACQEIVEHWNPPS
jgi:hypothetical protein